mmetsp:Transcript_15558/g.37314  ORF Transcript_15558/g.37314 Transcript_15558/m.37314 type:complete len:134 (-) Transcript_15558:352-753(-)
MAQPPQQNNAHTSSSFGQSITQATAQLSDNCLSATPARSAHSSASLGVRGTSDSLKSSSCQPPLALHNLNNSNPVYETSKALQKKPTTAFTHTDDSSQSFSDQPMHFNNQQTPQHLLNMNSNGPVPNSFNMSR